MVLAAIGLAAPGGAAAETKCPFTFRVQHNDRIGSLQLPAGNYNIFVINQSQLSCAHAHRPVPPVPRGLGRQAAAARGST